VPDIGSNIEGIPYLFYGVGNYTVHSIRGANWNIS
jgi:hypothetical protein